MPFLIWLVSIPHETAHGVLWDILLVQLSLEGKIDGEDAWITFHERPFEDETPRDVVDPRGGMRPKQPPAE